MIRTAIISGDSLPQGTGPAGTASTYGQGGTGSWWERTRDAFGNLAGFGPLISAGVRPTHLGYVPGNATEWTFAGAGWTAVLSTNAYDVLPYGGSGIQGFRSGSTINDIATWTNPGHLPPIVGMGVYIVDRTGGGVPQYRIDGGTWTTLGQTLIADNKILKCYIPTAVTSTFELRGYNGTSNVVYLPFAVEPYFVDPTTATVDGCILHNIAINGSKLHELALSTSGDRMAFFDSVKLGTGSPNSPTPNVGCVNMNINDVLLASTSGWAQDLSSFYGRVSALGPVGFVNPWETATGTYDQTQQTNYRAQTKTSATALGAKVLDEYDVWAANGWGSNAAYVTAGLLAADAVHQSTVGNGRLFQDGYWFMRTQVFRWAQAATAYPVRGGLASVVYGGARSAIVHAAGAPIAVA